MSAYAWFFHDQWEVHNPTFLEKHSGHFQFCDVRLKLGVFLRKPTMQMVCMQNTYIYILEVDVTWPL